MYLQNGKKKTTCLFYESTWRIRWVVCIFKHLLFSGRVTVCTRNNGTDSFRTLISSVPACALHRYYLTFIKQCLISPQRREASCANAHLLPFIQFKSFFFSPRLCLSHSPCLVFIHLIPSFALFQTLLLNYSSKPPLSLFWLTKWQILEAVVRFLHAFVLVSQCWNSDSCTPHTASINFM